MTTTLPARAPGADREVSPLPRAPLPRSRSRLSRLWRGAEDDPSWARPALLGLLILTGVLYTWGLSRSGWANQFYSAAAQAGSQSWKAWFFGSLDSANSITVDKPPAALWVMGLSARIFGVSSWSILAPEALMGVASVGLLYSTVRKVTRSSLSGLLAGSVLALTPVSVLMFRFNNPDALLVLLMVGAAAAVVTAIAASADLERPGRGAVRWLAFAGVLVGLAFLTKMLQALLVVPGFGLAYLIAAYGTVWQRTKHLLIAFAAMVASAGWYVALVEWWPFGSRPYIGGSQHNSIVELTLGYNGFGRLTGDETGSVGGGGRFGGWGQTGLLRVFNAEIGGQVSWLLPAALLLTVAGLVALGRRRRTDMMRAALVLWGTWLVVTALTFSLMGGIFHAYYTVALAPAIGACCAIGLVAVGRHIPRRIGDVVIGLSVILTAWWGFQLLNRSADWHPWLKWAVLLVGLAAGIALLVSRFLTRTVLVAVVLAAIAAVAAGPASYAVQTASRAETGSIPSAGPTVRGGLGGPGGGGPGGMPGLRMSTRHFGNQPAAPLFGNQSNGNGGLGSRQGGQGQSAGRGGAGSLLNGSNPGTAITKLLSSNAGDYTWVGAAIGAQNAAGYQLATGKPVMSIGGFNGSDPSPTLAQFKEYVKQHKIHYFLGGMADGRGGPGGGRGGSSTSSAIQSWVSSHFMAKTVGGVTVYDLTTGSGS
jgi:4-amino-4-deoxy-L-arabinose transferase-like glycosyltransferase